MKKGKVFSKRHIVTAVLALCLAAAVWLNMKYSSFEPPISDGGNTGDTQYFDANSNLGEAVQTQGSAATIVSARKDRNDSRSAALLELKNQIDSAELDENAKTDALKKYGELTQRVTDEASAETVIKTKGFDDALVMISDNGVTVIVPSDDLVTSETLQIQDAVTSQIQIDLEKIKIITVK